MLILGIVIGIAVAMIAGVFVLGHLLSGMFRW